MGARERERRDGRVVEDEEGFEGDADEEGPGVRVERDLEVEVGRSCPSHSYNQVNLLRSSRVNFLPAPFSTTSRIPLAPSKLATFSRTISSSS